jgi:hypothetical protein
MRKRYDRGIVVVEGREGGKDLPECECIAFSFCDVEGLAVGLVAVSAEQRRSCAVPFGPHRFRFDVTFFITREFVIFIIGIHVGDGSVTVLWR